MVDRERERLRGLYRDINEKISTFFEKYLSLFEMPDLNKGLNAPINNHKDL
jgi:hypothetical protein